MCYEIKDAISAHKLAATGQVSRVCLLVLSLVCALSVTNCSNETSTAENAAPLPFDSVQIKNVELESVLVGPTLYGFIDRYSRETNQLIMAEDYVGKPCEVTGQFDNLQFLEDGSMKVVLTSGKTLDWIVGPMPVVWSCVFGEAARSDLRSLRQGQRVTVRGRFGDLVKAQGDLCYQVLFYNCGIS